MPPRCSGAALILESTAATFGSIGRRDLGADCRRAIASALALPGATAVELTRVPRVLADAVGRLGR